MPYSINWEENGVYVVHRGIMQPEELDEMNEQLIRETQDKNCTYQIFDLLQVDDMPIAGIDTVDVAAEDLALSRSLTDVKVAFIVDKKQIREVVEKYIEISWRLNSTWHFRIFNSNERARNWIGVHIPQKAV